MARESQTDGDWTACPTGTLQGLAGRLRARRRRTIAVRAAGLAAVAVGILFAVRFVPNRRPADDYFHAGLYCSQVRPALADYRAGRLHGEFLSQVEQHLAECEPCRRVLNGLSGQAASASHGHVHPLTAVSQSGWRFASALR